MNKEEIPSLGSLYGKWLKTLVLKKRLRSFISLECE